MKKPGMMTERMKVHLAKKQVAMLEEELKKEKSKISINNLANDAAQALATFIIKQDFMSDAEIDAVCNWTIEQQRHPEGEAERRLLEAAVIFMRARQKEMEG